MLDYHVHIVTRIWREQATFNLLPNSETVDTGTTKKEIAGSETKEREMRIETRDPTRDIRNKQKTLGQIAYEATTEGGSQNFGPWERAPEVVRRVHEQMAKAVQDEVMKRINKFVKNS